MAPKDRGMGARRVAPKSCGMGARRVVPKDRGMGSAAHGSEEARRYGAALSVFAAASAFSAESASIHC